MKLTHTTKEKDLHACTKSMIRDAIKEHRPDHVFANQLKTGLIMDAMQIVAALKIEHDAALVKKEDERQKTIANELADLNCQHRLEMLYAAAKSVVARITEREADINEKINPESSALTMHHMGHHAAELFCIGRTHQYFNGFIVFLGGQLESRTKTEEEILKTLQFEYEQNLNRVLEGSDYYPNSTCPIPNLRNMGEFRALQSYTHFLRTMLNGYQSVLDGKVPSDFLEYVPYYRHSL